MLAHDMFWASLILLGLTFLAVISPLLTFSTLFQQKEWRLDRLREHLRRDGWFMSLIGKTRLMLVLFLLAVGLSFLLYIRFAYVPSLPLDPADPLFDPRVGFAGAIILLGTFLALWMGSFAFLSVVQIATRKQRMPVWTNKAKLIVVLSLALDGLLVLADPLFQLLLPLLQPLIVIIAWLMLKPVDAVLKKRVMDEAMQKRSAMKDVTVIGIAGSVGKTTVKELIAHLTQDLHPLVTPAHVNTEMGVAQWILKNKTHHSKLIIVEMGAYRAGEIALLCRITQPTIGVMTALGSDHLALFGSEQAIIEANGELIQSLPTDGHAFFYGDNAGCTELAKKSPCSVTIAKEAMLKQIPLEGRHNSFNILLAAAVARHLGVTNERIDELLQTFKPQAHTFNVTNERGVLILDDTYNISPLSLSAALDWADAVSKRPRVLLTSGLQETGPDEAQYLQKLGAKAAMCIERVIFIDKHGSDIFAQAFGKPVEVLSTETQRVEAGSALLAVGRMPLSTVTRLLPTV